LAVKSNDFALIVAAASPEMSKGSSRASAMLLCSLAQIRLSGGERRSVTARAAHSVSLRTAAHKSLPRPTHPTKPFAARYGMAVAAVNSARCFPTRKVNAASEEK
jgi:hypothetical protein